MSAIRTFLERRLRDGVFFLGQIRIADGIVVRHRDDADSPVVDVFSRPEDAREIARYDDAGKYRPLKTAPNLRRGWELRLRTVEELHLALDYFYPAALGTWLAAERRELAPVSLRETLGRQTGMYRVTQLIRDDQADALVEKICVEGCLRQRLWRVDGTTPFSGQMTESLPILCAEACNLFVAACRPVAKENLPSAG
ncbi:MAG TPA: DR2241 family protein [Chthoniobacterales bacterium]|jgi:sirohydrochlorin cobaltochelatase